MRAAVAVLLLLLSQAGAAKDLGPALDRPAIPARLRAAILPILRRRSRLCRSPPGTSSGGPPPPCPGGPHGVS